MHYDGHVDDDEKWFADHVFDGGGGWCCHLGNLTMTDLHMNNKIHVQASQTSLQ